MSKHSCACLPEEGHSCACLPKEGSLGLMRGSQERASAAKLEALAQWMIITLISSITKHQQRARCDCVLVVKVRLR